MLNHLLFEISKEAHELMENKLFVVFAVVVAFDYLTGVLKAAGWKVADSSVGMKGLIKHSLVFGGIMLFWLFAESFNMTALATGLTIFYMANYALSIMENFGVMGIWYPQFLKTKVEAELKRYNEQIEKGVTNSELKAEKSAVKVIVDNTTAEQPVVEPLSKVDELEGSQTFDVSNFGEYEEK